MKALIARLKESQSTVDKILAQLTIQSVEDNDSSGETELWQDKMKLLIRQL